MNKTQPMIIKSSTASGNEQLNVGQIRKISSQAPVTEQFGSYSSNHSFVEGSPDRRTPDITHPYLHHTQLV